MMFPKKPVNRKRKKSFFKTENPRRRFEEDTIETLRDKEIRLNAQIEQLEVALASHSTRSEARRANRRVTNPAPSRDFENYRFGKSHHDSFTYSEQRKNKQESNFSGLYFFFLIIVAAALSYWLFF